MSLEAAINLISTRPQPREGLNQTGPLLTVRNGSGPAWYFHHPHKWVTILAGRISTDVFARLVEMVPNVSGFAKAVARVEFGDGAVRLTKFGATQRGARELERLRLKRRIVIDVSTAERLPSTFGTKGTDQ